MQKITRQVSAKIIAAVAYRSDVLSVLVVHLLLQSGWVPDSAHSPTESAIAEDLGDLAVDRGGLGLALLAHVAELLLVPRKVQKTSVGPLENT